MNFADSELVSWFEELGRYPGGETIESACWSKKAHLCEVRGTLHKLGNA